MRQTTKPDASSFLERGGLWVAAQGVILLGGLFVGIRYRGSFALWGAPVIGWGLLVAGSGCGLAGFRALGSALTPFPKPRTEGRLVSQGIYAWIRHPLYTSVILASIGWAMLWQSWPALVVALVVAAFLDTKARREERWLHEKYSDYDAYARQTRRFLPGLY